MQAPSFAYYPSLPPQNIDAEEAVLGGILMDPNAIGRIAQTLRPEAFYISSHGEIYKAALVVEKSGGLVDLMTVTNWLNVHGLLEKVGGQAKLAELVDRTVSAVNVDQYAKLVNDKYYRRRLIETGHEIAQMAHDQWIGQEALNDMVEARLKKLPAAQKDERTKNIEAYDKMMAEVEEIELEIENPGIKRWELQRIAEKYHTNLRALDDCWNRHLIFSGETKLETWAEIQALATEHQEWLLHGFLPKQGLVLMHAGAGVGKTRLFYDWAYCVATGTAWNGIFNATKKRRRLLLVQTDELPSEMFLALEARGFQEGFDVMFLRHWCIANTAGLSKAIEEFQPDLILIDSLNSVSSSLLISENDAEYARPVLALRKLAEKTDKLIFLIHHSNKTGDVRGSSAIKAACSMEMKLTRDPRFPAPDSGRRLLSLGKTRSYRRPAEYSLEFEAETGEWHWLGETDGKEELELPLKEKIVNFLATNRNQRFENEELHHELGSSLDSIRRATRELASEGIISKVKKGKSNLYFLVWEDASTNHRYDHQKNVIGCDRIDDRMRNTYTESTPALSDHPITKMSIPEQKEEGKKIGSDDRIEEKKAQNQPPVGDTASDHSSDHHPITSDHSSNSDDAIPFSVTESLHSTDAAIDDNPPSEEHFCEKISPDKPCPSNEETLKPGQWAKIDHPVSLNKKVIVQIIKGPNQYGLYSYQQADDRRLVGGLERSSFELLSKEEVCRMGLSNQLPSIPYHAKNNPPKKGDRIRQYCGKEKTGQIVQVANRKYTIRWEEGQEIECDFKDLQALDIRREP